MPTTFIKGQSEPWNGGRLRKTTAGKWCAEVSDGGKIRRAFFETKDEAKKHLSDMKARRNVQGHLALALTSDETRDAMDALHRLEAAGCKRNLCQAVDFFIEHNRPRAVDMTLADALAAYMEQLRRPTDGDSPARPETLKSKKRRVKSFIEEHGEKSVWHITEADVSAWVESFGDVAPRTVRNRRAELQSVFNWCERALPDYTNTVCKIVQKKPGEAAPADIVQPGDALKILRYMEANFPPRYALSMALQFFAGIRPQELLRSDNPLRWENIRLEQGEIFIPQTASKTRTFRTVPITPNLRAWIERYPGQGRIAPAISRFRAARREAVRNATKMKVWPHDAARATYATAAGELHGLHKAAGWMGHSGTLTVFQAHYRGLLNATDAKRFFEIHPEPAAGNVIHLSTEATA